MAVGLGLADVENLVAKADKDPLASLMVHQKQARTRVEGLFLLWRQFDVLQIKSLAQSRERQAAFLRLENAAVNFKSPQVFARNALTNGWVENDLLVSLEAGKRIAGNSGAARR
jgi:hypothetical protein